LFDLFQSVRSK